MNGIPGANRRTATVATVTGRAVAGPEGHDRCRPHAPWRGGRLVKVGRASRCGVGSRWDRRSTLHHPSRPSRKSPSLDRLGAVSRSSTMEALHRAVTCNLEKPGATDVFRHRRCASCPRWENHEGGHQSPDHLAKTGCRVCDIDLPNETTARVLHRHECWGRLAFRPLVIDDLGRRRTE
jgi:hypothetical protein